MFLSILLLVIPFLTIAFLPLALKSFSSEELDQMGVQLEGTEVSIDPLPESSCLRLQMQVACGNA